MSGKIRAKIATLYPGLLLDAPAESKFSQPSVSLGQNIRQPLKQDGLKKIQAGVFNETLQEAASFQNLFLSTCFSPLFLPHLEMWERLLAVMCFPHAS